MIEFVIYPAAAAVALLAHRLVRRSRDAKASALLGARVQVSAELRSPGWRLLFDDKGRQLAVLSDDVRVIVPYEKVIGWRQEQEVPTGEAAGAAQRAILIRTNDPRWPVLDIPLGTSDASIAQLWLKRLNANVQHLRTAEEPHRPVA